MEEQRPSGAIDNPENSSPSDDTPSADLHDRIGSASGDSFVAEEKKPSLGQRLTQAFREGVAAAKPDYVKRPEVRIPRAERKRSPVPEGGGIPDRAVQEGGNAAAAVGDKAAVALDHVVQLAKKAPGAMHKYAQAFREGASSVKPREERPPRPAEEPRPVSTGKAMLGRALHPSVSAREILRGFIVAVKPSPVRGAWRTIRLCKKRIGALYTEIGIEAANAWADGPVETEKIVGLLNELRKNEDEIRKLTDLIAEIESARKTDAGRNQPAEKEVVISPAAEPAPKHAEEADALPPEERAAIEMNPAAEPAPEQTDVAEEVAPWEEVSAGADRTLPEELAAMPENKEQESEGHPAAEEVFISLAAAPAPEHMGDAEAAPPEEASAGADQTPSEVPARSRRKGTMNRERQR